MTPLITPDYDNSILSAACSMLKHYGADPHGHATQKEVDEALKRDPRNVVIMLFDGMGVNLLEKHLPADSFLRTHMKTTVSSVFPPTTVAATTSIQCGLSPAEHGWLGWTMYFNEVNDNVTTFSNKLVSTKKPAAKEHLAETYRHYENLCDQIHRASPDVSADTISMRSHHFNYSIGSSCRQVLRLTKKPGKHYLYCYWINPDHLIHKYGVDSPQVHKTIVKINNQTEKMYRKMQDTTAVILADHGLIDTKWVYLEDAPELMDMLVREPSIESRAATFFVKPDQMEQFKTAYEKKYKDHFVLLTRQEVFDRHLFGPGTPCQGLKDSVGDYLGIATADYSMAVHRGSHELIGMHAGLTEAELTVPLIILEK